MREVVIDGLNMKLGEKNLLKDINIDIAGNKSIGVIGESGSGKSILLKLFVGKMPSNAVVNGKIQIDGDNLMDLTKREWKYYRGHKIAYIAQNPFALFNEIQKIKSHGMELLRGKFSMTKQDAAIRFKSALMDFKLEDVDSILDKYPFQLSGGMLQRIMIAMMMELRPHTIIADEPTSALDYYNTQNVMKMLKKCKVKGTRLIVISHDFDLIKNLADEVIVLKSGKIIEQGDVEEIFLNPKTEYVKLLMEARELRQFNRKGSK